MGGCNLVGIESDGFGIIPDSLRTTLENWSSLHAGKSAPRVLYTIPTGGNPTGASMTEGRKREIYQIASEFDLIILEDDPYYYLQFEEPGRRSMMSMDNEGRVVRFDSFSKILSSGLRIGFVTGPEEIVKQINLHSQSANMHTSGASQALVIALLEKWGIIGWEKHVDDISAFYLRQRDLFLAAADKHLVGLAEWTIPEAGMFVWLKLNGIDDSESLITEKAKDKKVLLVPGTVFMPNSEKSSYVRAAYSSATPEEMDEALRRFASLLREVRG